MIFVRSALACVVLAVTVGVATGEDPGHARAAAFEPYPAGGDTQMKVRLAPDTDTIRPGAPFRLGLLFEVPDGWYTYSGIEGAAPMPTEVEVHLPEGFHLLATQWPEPVWKEIAGEKVGTYSEDFVVTLTVQPPATLPDDKYTVRVTSRWQVCHENVCRLEEGYNRLILKTGATGKPTAAARWFARIE